MADEALRVFGRVLRLLDGLSPEARERVMSLLVGEYPGVAGRAYERLRKAIWRAKPVPDTTRGDVPDISPPDVRDNVPDRGLASPLLSSSVSSSRTTQLDRESRQLLAYLNERTGQHFRSVETHLKRIRARLKSGATFDDCKAVIDLKTREWLGTDRAQYLRPTTLFGEEKFEQYLGRAKGVSTFHVPCVDFDTPIEWGQPGSLMQLYNASVPPECAAATTLTPGLLEAERRTLAGLPDQVWWKEVFRQFHRSRFLRGKVPPTADYPKPIAKDFAWLLGTDDAGIERAALVYDGRYRD